jgi:hypothetical protein
MDDYPSTTECLLGQMQHRDNSDDRVTTSDITKGKEYPVVMTVGYLHHIFTASKDCNSEPYGLQGDSKKYVCIIHVEASHDTMEIDTVMECTQVEGPLARGSRDDREQYHVASACGSSCTRDQHLHSRVVRFGGTCFMCVKYPPPLQVGANSVLR